MSYVKGTKELRDCYKCGAHWYEMEVQGPVTHLGDYWFVTCNDCEYEGPSEETLEDAIKSYQKEWVHPKYRSNYIKKENLEPGRPYRVWARNFEYAIWTGEKFAGLRKKFSNLFMDFENHWDDSNPLGTVKPLKLLQ